MKYIWSDFASLQVFSFLYLRLLHSALFHWEILLRCKCRRTFSKLIVLYAFSLLRYFLHWRNHLIRNIYEVNSWKSSSVGKQVEDRASLKLLLFYSIAVLQSFQYFYVPLISISRCYSAYIVDWLQYNSAQWIWESLMFALWIIIKRIKTYISISTITSTEEKAIAASDTETELPFRKVPEYPKKNRSRSECIISK